MNWRPIETLPKGVSAILYQPADKDKFRNEGMIIGSLERGQEGEIDWANVDNVDGYEWECDVTHPTHWMPLPEPPK